MSGSHPKAPGFAGGYLLTTDEEAEAFLKQDLSDLDFSQFKPVRFELENRSGLTPPTIAGFLISLLAKKRYRASLLACLEEDFRADLAAGMSLARAKRRYWAAALNSIGPQLWAAIRRIGLIGFVADYIRGKLG